MPTTNPVPSTDPSDLLFNAGKLDEVVNGAANSFTDRLGIARRTVAGMNADFDAQLADAESDLNVYRADAAASAAEALGYLNVMRATSYGAYASDPATDPLGNPPTIGDEYFNTTANLLKRWNGTTWQASDINTANLAATSGASLVGYDGGTVQDVLDGAKSLQDYAALRSYTGRASRVYITGPLITKKPAGIAGPFQYDPTDATSTDNGGTIIVLADGRRFKRDYSGAVSVGWFGAVGDGATYDTNAFAAAAIAAGDGGAIMAPAGGAYAIDSGVSLNGATLGVTLLCHGATILLATPSATISIGREASGIIGGTIQAVAAFTGNAITLAPMARAAAAGRSFFLSDLNITCPTSTGKSISGHVTVADTRIVGLRSSNVTVNGFEYAVYFNSAAPSSVGFINDNAFVNLRIPGRTPLGIHMQASATASNEVAGNTFTNLVTQYFSGVSVRHILVSDVRCKRNKFIGYDAWDIGGAATLLIEDLGLETQWFGTIPTSGGVASFSSSAIGIINKDAGSQTAELMLGEYRRSQSVQTRKVQTFDTANLTTLDVRNGDVMVEGTVVSGTRLTNIIGAGQGQEITIQFGGNTLLSNAWGGTGQIFTRDRISRTPAAGDVAALIYIGSAWYEIAQSEGIPVSVPASSIASAANAINTTGKFAGRTIWDSTNNRALRASGSSATSVWWVVDGSASVTPA